MAMTEYCYLDAETTGVDPYSDRIVELRLVRVTEAGYELGNLLERVNPQKPISAEATAVHGITNEDVANLPTLAEHVRRIQELVADAVLVGYASRMFDVPLLDTELRRYGAAGLPHDADGMIDVQEIDLYRVWAALEPRTLEGAVKRFTSEEHEAHTAAGDVKVLPALMAGMAEAFGADVQAMREATAPPNEVDRDGKFKLREGDGKVVFNFGQHKDKPVAKFGDYLDWMLKKDFSPEVKAWCRKFRAKITAAERGGGYGGSYGP